MDLASPPSVKTLRPLCLALLVSLTASSNRLFATSVTSFGFTSSPTAWVGAGTTRFITPGDGHTFTVGRNYQGGVSFAITDFDSPIFDWWYLDFASADGSALAPGDYLNATRYPFNAFYPAGHTNGLSFVGNGRGDNQLTGFFTVLEATYGLGGSVLSFAADFTQYDENLERWWNVGSIRYNSSIADVPDGGATFALTFLGLALLVTVRQLRTKTHATSCG